MSSELSIVDNNQMSEVTLRDKPLLVFSKNGPSLVGQAENYYEISFDDATRNILVLGGTGRGKTESIMLPVSAHLISNGCTGLILDSKGDFTILASQYSDSTRIVGPFSGTKINLIGDIEVGTFRAIIEDLQSRFHQNEKYWGSLGVEDAVLIFLFIRETGRQPTLKNIHDGLVDPITLCIKLERFLQQQPKVSDELLDQITTRSSDEFGLLRLGKFHGLDTDSSRAKEQYSWQTNAIIKSLAVITNNQCLLEAFCTTDSYSVASLIHQSKNTLILDLNADQYPDAAYTISRILRLQYMRSITTTYQKRQPSGLGETTFTFLIIDEYQHFINAKTRGQTDTLRDDNTWFDRSRSYGHINVVATQSISSLYAQADKFTVDTIIQNNQNTIILPTTDTMTIQRAEALCGHIGINSVSSMLINPACQGEGLVHVANSRSRNGAAVGGLMRMGRVAKPKFSFMNTYIGLNRNTEPRKVQFRGKVGRQNPYSKINRIVSNGRLHVVVNMSQPSTYKWLSSLSAHHGVLFVGVIKTGSSFNHSYVNYENSVEAGDLVVIPNLDMQKHGSELRSSGLLELLKELKKASVSIVFGKCFEDISEIERISDLLASDSEELISLVHRILGNKINSNSL